MTCVGVINQGGDNGHNEVITCFEFYNNEANPAESFMLSADANGEIKAWKTEGSFLGTWIQPACVTSMKLFKDSLGGELRLIFIIMLLS
jgi:hypothetical protein